MLGGIGIDLDRLAVAGDAHVPGDQRSGVPRELERIDLLQRGLVGAALDPRG